MNSLTETCDIARRAFADMRFRGRIFHLSRAITVTVVGLAIGTLFLQPTTWWTYVLDIVFRGYVMFLCTVMAHEATHGHLGRTRRANRWWGRFALLPITTTFGKFRRTHLLHHAHTNEPDKDPDYFLATDREWEIPIRAVLMPYNWLLWLRRHRKLGPAEVWDMTVSVLMIAVMYGTVMYFVGWRRVVLGVLPANVIVSLILWYPFAVKTHEGYSTGSPESRSHNYYGAVMYWFSCGLSMHRVHHLNPALTWVELRKHVERTPGRGWRRWLPRRDIRPDRSHATMGAPSR